MGDPLRRPELVASPSRDHQRRGGATARIRAKMQCPFRRDESPRNARCRLCGLLSARRHGESAQGIASWAGAGPHELLAVLGQSIPGAPDGHRVCVAAGVAATGSWHGLRHGTSLYVAGAAAQVAVWVDARCAASCCSCLARRPGARPGNKSPWLWAPYQVNYTLGFVQDRGATGSNRRRVS